MTKLFELVFKHGSWELIKWILKAANAVEIMLQKATVSLNLMLDIISFLLVFYHCVKTIVSSSRDGDGECTIVRIVEIYFYCKWNGLFALEGNLNLYLLFGNSQISSLGEVDFDIDIWKLLAYHVLNVYVLISAIDNLKRRFDLLIESDDWHYDIWLIEKQRWIAGWGFNCNLKVLLVVFHLFSGFFLDLLSLIDGELEFFSVVTLNITVEKDLQIYFLKALKPSSAFLKTKRINVWIIDTPFNGLLLGVLDLKRLVFLVWFKILLNYYLAEINLLLSCHQSTFYAFASAWLLKIKDRLVTVQHKQGECKIVKSHFFRGKFKQNIGARFRVDTQNVTEVC